MLEIHNMKMVDQVPSSVLVYRITTQTQEILYANPAAYKLFECSSPGEFASFSKGDYLNLLDEGDRDDLVRSMNMSKELHVEEKHSIEYHIRTATGKVIFVEDQGNVLEIPEWGECVICTLTPIGEKERYVPTIYDRLTGLFNMDHFLRIADQLLQKADQVNDVGRYQFVYFDIRGFKLYNLENGLKSGDQLLCCLADILTTSFPGDLISRFTSDHFVVLTKNRTLTDTLTEVRQQFFGHMLRKGVDLKAGVYRTVTKGVKAPTACDFAKAAVDSIKHTARNVYYYDEVLEKKLTIGHYIAQNIDEAIENKWIKVYFQPVIRTITGAVCGLEALARWVDPVHGFLSPADFIPVLEDCGLIYKLDKYMVEEGCRLISTCQKMNIVVVPVAFNLSRIDFLKCDMYEHVEAMTKKYDIPRDMVNIELTESMMITDPELLSKELTRFQENGYQVWMDDFGSGFSSLNVLKDYHFDEIKLDMVFLRSFNRESRQIIRSVVSMAKKLGIQTLAEGVETQEQLDFLKEIGCDKAQGFLISRPRLLNDLSNVWAEGARKIETRALRSHYDKLSNVDFMTDRPLAITEYDGRNIHFLYMNAAYRKVLKSCGAVNYEMVYESINSEASPLSRQFRSFQKTLPVGGDFAETDYIVRGYAVRLRARVLSRAQGYTLAHSEVANVSVQSTHEQENKRNQIYRLIYAMFEAVYQIDLKNNHLQELFMGPFSRDKRDEEFNKLTISDAIQFAANYYIYKEDQKAFLSFVDVSTVRERIQKSERGFLADYFRTRVNSGTYIWEVHYITAIPNSDEFIYCTKYAPLNTKQFHEFDDYADSFDKIMWQGLMDSKSINFFWKDRNRRFLGANQCFLNTYGFDSIEDILGKTDEEMLWHIDEIPFRKDEQTILRTGTPIVNRFGKCVIRGVDYDILATKEPIYHDGEIVGLYGVFTPVQGLASDDYDNRELHIVDSSTGVMSARGIMPVVFDYIEGWELRKEEFAIITLSLPQYRHVLESYGEEVGAQVLQMVGDVLRRTVSVTGSCARVYAGTFVIYTKVLDRERVQALMLDMQEQIAAIHWVGDYPVTLNPEISVYYASQSQNIQDLLWHSLLLAVFRNVSSVTDQYYEREVTAEILDRIPAAVAVFSASPDGEVSRVYLSPHARDLSGYSEDYEASLPEMIDNVFPDDREKVRREVAESIKNRSGMICEYRIVKSDGSIAWLRHHSRPYPQMDGSCLFYTMYMDVTPEKQVEEDRRKNLAEMYGEYMAYIRRMFAEDGTHEGSEENLLPILDFQNRLIKSLGEVYISMHIVNLKENTFLRLASRDSIYEILRDFTSAQAALDKTVETMIKPSFQKVMKEFFDLNTLSDRIGDRQVLECDYDGAISGWCRGSFVPVTRDPDGSIREVLLVVQHIEDEKKREAKLQGLLELDGFTKLKNRVNGEKYINRCLEKGEGGLFCLFDVDHFKHYNDTYGHAVGDKVIQMIADSMRTTFRETDILVRAGGDEFIFFVPNVSDRKTAEVLIERLIQHIHKGRVEELPEMVTISAGAVLCEPKEYSEFDQVFRKADANMYSCKRRPGDSYRLS